MCVFPEDHIKHVELHSVTELTGHCDWFDSACVLQLYSSGDPCWQNADITCLVFGILCVFPL